MVIKMKDLIDQQNLLRDKFINEADPPQPPAKGGGDDAPKPEKLKIDIPDSPFEPDVNQIKDQLKNLLKQWKVKEYPSDEYRWKDYYRDVLKLVKYLDGDK